MAKKKENKPKENPNIVTKPVKRVLKNGDVVILTDNRVFSEIHLVKTTLDKAMQYAPVERDFVNKTLGEKAKNLKRAISKLYDRYMNFDNELYRYQKKSTELAKKEK